MDFRHYAEGAAHLVNADVDSAGQVRDLLAARPWLAGAVCDEDAVALSAAQPLLRSVVDASAGGDGPGAVERLNALLAHYPIRPRISGHDETTWHLHVSDTDAPVAEVLMAEAVFGLTLLVTELGATRIGRCAGAGCERAFVDTTTNQTRRYCSSRCSTRTNVANFRQRQRAAAARR